MPYQRILDLSTLLKHRSLFLFGPRQTGKTTYLHDRYPHARFVDLLDARTFRELSARPELLRLSLTPSDTLIVIDEIQKLPALLAVATAKFYFFDVGVAHALVGREVIRLRTGEYGRALEHLMFLELRAYLDYTRNRTALTFWRTHTKHEVDFLVGDAIAIEVKAKERVGEQDLRGVRALAEELSLSRKIVVSNELWRRTTDDHIEVIPVDEFLRDLWAGKVI